MEQSQWYRNPPIPHRSVRTNGTSPKNSTAPPFPHPRNGRNHLLRPNRSETGSSAKIPRRGFVSTVLHAAWCRAIRTPDERTIGMDKRYRKRSSRKTAASGAVFAKDCAKPLCNENRVRENPPETGETGTSAQIRFLNFIININRSLLIISWFITK